MEPRAEISIVDTPQLQEQRKRSSISVLNQGLRCEGLRAMEVQLHTLLTWVLSGMRGHTSLSVYHQGKKSWCPWIGDPVCTRTQPERFEDELNLDS
jgi:hypothetical protein